MNEDLKIRLGLEGEKATGSGLDRTRRKVKGLGDDTERAGGKMRRGFATAGRAAAAAGVAVLGMSAVVGVQATNAARDLAETMSKSTVTYGKHAGKIEMWGNKSAEALGMSKQLSIDAAAGLAVYGNSAGLSQKELVSFSSGLVKAAADLGSFHNASPEDTLQAIKSGLAGEAEPLKRFGILMNDATLKAEAMKLGLIKTQKDALTPGQKVLAARAVIMKGLGKAEGDFARTSGGLANQQKILTARWENAKATLGAGLLPIVTKATTRVSAFVQGMDEGTGAGGRFVVGIKSVAKFTGQAADKIRDAYNQGKKFLTWLDSGTGAADATSIAIGGLVAGLAAYKGTVMVITGVTKAWAFAQGLLNAEMMLNPVGLIVAGIIGLVAAIVIAYKKVDWFRNGVNAAFTGIKKAVGAVIGFVKRNWEAMLIGMTGPVGLMIVGVIKNFDKIKAGFGAIVDWVKGKWNSFAEGLNTGLAAAGKIPGVPDDIRIPVFDEKRGGGGGSSAPVSSMPAQAGDAVFGSPLGGRSIQPGSLGKKVSSVVARGESQRAPREVVLQVNRRELGRALVDEAAWLGARS